jgi:H+/Cl- antiporter ClcA
VRDRPFGVMRGRGAAVSVVRMAPEKISSDPYATLRSRRYLGLLVFAAVLGVPISAGAYWFLQLADNLQTWVFRNLPTAVGFQREPLWWPVIPLAFAGLLVGAIIRYVPGQGGESPAAGFKPGTPVSIPALPGIAVAAMAGIGLGAVVGPEAPLIALGGGLAVVALKLVKSGQPPELAAMIAATGSFAALSTLLGSPLAGAFLLMEAAGLGGLMAAIVLVPGLLAAGIGTLIFTGLGSWTGYGVPSLKIPNLPPATTPTAAEFGWALVAGLGAGVIAVSLRRGALVMRTRVEPIPLVAVPLIGLATAGLAIAYQYTTGKGMSDILFDGQSELPKLILQNATFSLGALLLILLLKGVAYFGAMAGFRGGPIFPSLFLGAAGGLALSHAPGLSTMAGLSMGIAAMTAGMVRLPFTSVLLTALFLQPDGITLMPLMIVSVVVSYLVVVRFTPTSQLNVPQSPTTPPDSATLDAPSPSAPYPDDPAVAVDSGAVDPVAVDPVTVHPPGVTRA